jgi:aminoglycoside phosphotransferase (APT) family kinase protein
MAGVKMHTDEVDTNEQLVARLLSLQFPQWSQLPITAVVPAGTDNSLYRLGDDLVVRFPRIPSATAQVEKEHRWLPNLAAHLPLAIPAPIAMGQPGAGYDWNWSVYRWIEGSNATAENLSDLKDAATGLAEFMIALQNIDSVGGPPAGAKGSSRGVPLAMRDAETRAAIKAVDGMVDTEAVTRAWEAALQVPAFISRPVWIHGDLQSGNLLAANGRLKAVIDFGCLCVGDPACDLQVAWNLFDREARSVFRAALGVDDATWARGRGWALSVSLIALPYYHQTNPVLAAISRHAITEVLADHGASDS